MAKSHKGPFVCHLCGMVISLAVDVRRHYDEQHRREPVQFGDAARMRREVESVEEAGLKKVARIQGQFNREVHFRIGID